jgi:CheY-like chemotaxis protein
MTAMVGGSGADGGRRESTGNATTRNEVLVIEDDGDLQGIVGDVLEGRGYQPRFASDGAEGLALLRRHGDRVCVVLLDLGLATMDGFEFLAHQAREPAIQAIPVIVMSGRDGLGKCPGLGAWVGTLQKPIGMHELLTAVRQCAR